MHYEYRFYNAQQQFSPSPLPGTSDDVLGDAAASETDKHTFGLMDKESQVPSWYLGQGFGSLLQESLQVFQWPKKPISYVGNHWDFHC